MSVVLSRQERAADKTLREGIARAVAVLNKRLTLAKDRGIDAVVKVDRCQVEVRLGEGRHRRKLLVVQRRITRRGLLRAFGRTWHARVYDGVGAARVWVWTYDDGYWGSVAIHRGDDPRPAYPDPSAHVITYATPAAAKE